ncbi:MBL fold metallo-hydrolase [Streptomyces sp. NPDC026672]|uniref:MBL fold metallo-hydrolase n=1 Tax=unclassified Streptomyces TaxID=2593676 RepID=UPI0033C6320D
MTFPARSAHLRIGSTTLTYLPDGHGVHPAATVFPEADRSVLHDYLDDEGQVILSFGSFLLRTGGRRILVDLGMGAADFRIPGVGRIRSGSLLESLAGEGLSPQDIDTVVYTHLHRDHVGWTSDVSAHPADPDGPASAPAALTFPRARHLVAEAEWTYWTKEADADAGGPDPRGVLEPLGDVVGFLGDGDEVAPGVTVRLTAGHTPGHLALEVTDPDGPGSERVLIVGDVLHSAAQIAEPGWSFFADVDARLALTTREKVLAEPGTILAAGHFSGQVFGRVEHSTSGTTWLPHPTEDRPPAGGGVGSGS